MRAAIFILMFVVVCTPSLEASSCIDVLDMVVLEPGHDTVDASPGVVAEPQSWKKWKKILGYVKTEAERRGKRMTYARSYEIITINPRSFVISLNAVIDGKATVISLAFHGSGGGLFSYCFTIFWNDFDDYRRNSSKESLAGHYARYASIDVGPVRDDEPFPQLAEAQ